MTSFSVNEVYRSDLGRVGEVLDMPNLVHIQRESYDKFLQRDKDPEKREDTGLEAVFRGIFPISDYDGKATLEYVKYEVESSKYSISECMQRGVNYSAPVKITVNLIIWDISEDGKTKDVKSIKQQSIYIGEVPIMTDKATFIINGAERVVVSQMHRSPGVFYYHDQGKNDVSGKFLYGARVIPYRGSWLDIEFDSKDLLYFRVDRKRKLLLSTLLRALKMNNADIVSEFYNVLSVKKEKGVWISEFQAESFKGLRVKADVISYPDKKVLIAKGTKVTPRLFKEIKKFEGKEYIFDKDDIIDRSLAEDVVDDNGEVIASVFEEVNESIYDKVLHLPEVKELRFLVPLTSREGFYIRNTVAADKVVEEVEAKCEIYKVMRPGEPVTEDVSSKFFHDMLFNPDKYDLSRIGRMKINTKHNLDCSEEFRVLTKDDIIEFIRYTIALRDGIGEIDDIDNLSNRRVRSVGELIENQFRIGLARMERIISERLGAAEIDTVMPHDLISGKMLSLISREFFGTSQLSQFMDQTNPLAEITHKRRVSALGPGGLTKDRAGFEVRDVHPTHYGRICPIETPEGPNIGLINSLACYARINSYGFIESPYRKIENNKISKKYEYLSALEEARYTIAPANVKLAVDDAASDLVMARSGGEIVVAKPSKIDYIDVSPKQIVSVAASLIPFLENDDANRALMGSNMQRQAVPLINCKAPLVGTGMEKVVAVDSRAAITVKRSGVVDQVDANRIVIRSTDKDNEDVDIYNLVKFAKSNQNTCINQRPIVKIGDKVSKGDVIADGSSTHFGELALGRDVLVAFMSWNGYNFEDAIVLSDRLVKDDVYTSLHIQEFEVVARDTRLGPEEITRDLPNTMEDSLKALDEIGLVHVGASVKPGDILVGKVTPKAEAPITPEEKLLRSVFGEKASEMSDTSLRVPAGGGGIVVRVRVFTRRGVAKDERAIALERIEIAKLIQNRDDKIRIFFEHSKKKIISLLESQTLAANTKTLIKDRRLTREDLEPLSKEELWSIKIKDENCQETFEEAKLSFNNRVDDIEKEHKEIVSRVKSGDDLPQGALKVVKVYVANKQKIQPGDKMAGRHGNKGVIAKIMPQEDMPFLEDGTPVDVILSPLGVPSRMNVGQILEVHLGWASRNFGKKISKLLDDYTGASSDEKVRKCLEGIYSSANDKAFVKRVYEMSSDELLQCANKLRRGVNFATPVFDGAGEKKLDDLIKAAGCTTTSRLRDGRTGEYFDREIVVGSMYMMKLDHLVDDKIHARSVGPYSLVTQQPLGGKSHFGGQRFGEMECWALQAYGAAYTLQEMLTVKSDDVSGRVKVYNSIVRGDSGFEYGIPESFNVMVKELRSLCLNIEMIDNSSKRDEEQNEGT